MRSRIFPPGMGAFQARGLIEIFGGEIDLHFSDDAAIGMFGNDPTFPDQDETDDFYFDLYEVNRQHAVQLTAEISGGVGDPSSAPNDAIVSGFSVGEADPVIRFDQEAFDAMMGDET